MLMMRMRVSNGTGFVSMLSSGRVGLERNPAAEKRDSRCLAASIHTHHHRQHHHTTLVLLALPPTPTHPAGTFYAHTGNSQLATTVSLVTTDADPGNQCLLLHVYMWT
ncbi:hypothetical protein KQX54_004284 [Cotesia glomerata]|uniref:Uncharacterized protein n=1 Tax=Cotesia glomerata TaxID=32391 RepID=A0AAV7IHS8_COTGL|nr:hypothetical protein KQX54_004284 [Cotesia glomerata]